MPKSRLFLHLAVVVLVAGWGVASSATLTPERQRELIHLLRQDCGACHGMRLKGGLGPALEPERLRSYSTEQLAATILNGRPGTPMPPWSPFLSQQEANWLAERLKQGDVP